MKAFAIAALVVCLGSAAPAQTAATAEDLIKQVLSGFEAKDQPALLRLAIDRAEYKAYIWPRVSASTNAKFEKFYADHKQGSDFGLSDSLRRYGGQKWQLVKVNLGPAISQGKGYRVLSAPTVTVRSQDGAETAIRPVGGLVEHDGSFKVSTYFVRPKPDAK